MKRPDCVDRRRNNAPNKARRSIFLRGRQMLCITVVVISAFSAKFRMFLWLRNSCDAVRASCQKSVTYCEKQRHTTHGSLSGLKDMSSMILSVNTQFTQSSPEQRSALGEFRTANEQQQAAKQLGWISTLFCAARGASARTNRSISQPSSHSAFNFSRPA